MFIKRILFSLLGIEGYLRFVSRIFLSLYFSGILRVKEKFGFHYFVKKLIRKGDTVIDIGGNLGYYTVSFARLTGRGGKVLSVEPVTLFRKVLERNIKRYRLGEIVTVLPFALGKENNARIQMGVPSGSKHFRHGLTRVVEGNTDATNDFIFEETMMRPDSLFGDLDRIDYIKCDVEGYEIHILPEMISVLQKHQPLIQIETDGENREKIIDLLNSLGYTPHYVQKGKIHRYTGNESFHTGDLLFIGSKHQDRTAPFLSR